MAVAAQNQVVYVDGDVPQLPLQLGQLLVDSSQVSPGATNFQQCTSQSPLLYEPVQGGYPALFSEITAGIEIFDYYKPYWDARRYGVAADGVTDDTPNVQRAFDAAAVTFTPWMIFPSGTIRLQNSRNDLDFCCAVVISGLRSCEVRGVNGTKFYSDSGGSGAAEFGQFRVEQCRDVQFKKFEMDGSGIPLDGTGGNRSRGFVVPNFDVNDKPTDLAVANADLEFDHIYAHDIGGLVNVPPRSDSLPQTPYTDVLSIHDNIAENMTGQDHFVGLIACRNVEVRNNRAINPLSADPQIGNLFCDASAGCATVMIANNYAYGFTGGGKAETRTNQGPMADEDRPSYNVCFHNNTFEQIGDPVTIIYPGPSGGGWYGIKLNGINHSASSNTITARTIDVTTGGLYQGIQITSSATTPVESLQMVFGNSITGPVIGINHDCPSSNTEHQYVAHIFKNKVYDTYAPGTPIASNDGAGIIASRNAKVSDNQLYRTKYCAVSLNFPDQTYVFDNEAYNCCEIDHPVAGARVTYAQEDAGTVGYFEFTNNRIYDDRGASAAEYGYFLRAGTTYTNKYVLSPGLVDTVVTAVTYDKYFSYQGTSLALDTVAYVGPRTIYTTGIPSGTAPWSGMAWRVDDRAVRDPQAVGSPKAWVCTTAGTPGTWTSEGNL